MKGNPLTFLGSTNNFQQAQGVIFGAPFDGTTSFRAGARFAPPNMRENSYGIETYSPYQKRDLEEIQFFDAGDLEIPFGNPEKALDLVENFTQKILDHNKIPIMLGGEHLLTLGSVRALFKQHPNLHLIHFDAHADLRDNYLGEVLSHATVMKRILDFLGNHKIYQFGIRSGEKEEFTLAKTCTFLNPFNLKGIDKILPQIQNIPLYITIDLDVLDPSVFPGTGTPEPGGVFYHELQEAIMQLKGLNIVGFDLCELSPHYDSSGVSTLVACKVLRECLLSFLK